MQIAKTYLRPRERSGNALIEFAVGFPLLLLIFFGAVDFGRVFYYSVSLANAAEAGALYGSRNLRGASDPTGMAQAALNDARDIPGAASSAVTYCRCADGTAIACDGSRCSSGAFPRMYVRVRATARFSSTLFGSPGTPNVGSSAVMRVQ